MATPDSLAERANKMTEPSPTDGMSSLQRRADAMTETPHRMVPATEAAKQQDEATVRAEAAAPTT